MSESTEIATQGEGLAPETVPQPAETTPDTGTETPKAEQTEETEQKPKVTPWFQRRIDELTREKHEERRAREVIEAQLRQIQQPGQTAPQNQPPPGYVPASELARVEAEAVEKIQFVQACNDIAEGGAAKFADFGDAVRNIQLLGVDVENLRNPFMQVITSLGKDDGAKAIYDLGNNPDEAARILSLPPARMAVEVAKLAAKPARAVPVSKVPDPIKPIASGPVRNAGEPDPNSPEWTVWFRKNFKG